MLWLCLLSIHTPLKSQWVKQNPNKAMNDFKKAINVEFSKTITGNAFSNIGNFVTLSTTDKSLGFSGNILKNNGILGFEVSGGAQNGIFNMFNENSINSNFAGSLKYHYISKVHMAARDFSELQEIERDIQKLNTLHKRDTILIALKKELVEARVKRDKFKVNIDRISTTMKNGNLGTLPNQCHTTVSAEKCDSLKYELGIAIFDSLELHKRIKILEHKDSKEDLIFIANRTKNKKEQSLVDKKVKLGLRGLDISWWSFGISVKNNSFKLSQPVGNISDTSFVNQQFSLAYSRYFKDVVGKNNEYWSLGVILDYTSNFDELSQVTVEERSAFSTDPFRETVKQITTYSGDYSENQFRLTLFYDYYKFFKQLNSSVALHVNPTIYYGRHKVLVSSLRIGALIPFANSKEKPSRINVEIFYHIKDMFNNLRGDNAINNRNQVGITATVPLTFLFL